MYTLFVRLWLLLAALYCDDSAAKANAGDNIEVKKAYSFSSSG